MDTKKRPAGAQEDVSPVCLPAFTGLNDLEDFYPTHMEGNVCWEHKHQIPSAACSAVRQHPASPQTEPDVSGRPAARSPGTWPPQRRWGS